MRALPHSALLGASGIVFMLIMLASLSGFSGGIPVTMLLVAALYFGQQVYDIIFVHDNVANFMHIVGGLCGTVFGYTYAAFPGGKSPAANKRKQKERLLLPSDRDVYPVSGTGEICYPGSQNKIVKTVGRKQYETRKSGRSGRGSRGGLCPLGAV